MSDYSLKREDIPSQIIFMYNSNTHPCHIRDRESRYIYINAAMHELLDLPKSFDIEGKLLSEIPHGMMSFTDEIHQHDKTVMKNGVTLSLLKMFTCGKKTCVQPYIFNIHPFYNSAGNVVGTLALGQPCRFFSSLQYIDGECPKPVISQTLMVKTFTRRELEVIFFTLHGLNSKETAKRLGISHRTVENRLCILYQKVGVHDICQFREFCKEIGLDNHIPHAFLKPDIRIIN